MENPNEVFGQSNRSKFRKIIEQGVPSVGAFLGGAQSPVIAFPDYSCPLLCTEKMKAGQK